MTTRAKAQGTIRPWLREHHREHKTSAELHEACMKALGCTARPIYKGMADLRARGVAIPETQSGVLKKENMAPTSATSAQLVAPAKAGHSLAEFRQTYDKDLIVPTKIKAALKSLGSGWEYEMEFTKRSGVGISDLGNYRMLFEGNWYQIRKDGKRVWSGSKATIESIREMV